MEDSEVSDQAIEWFACLRSDTVTNEKRLSFIEWLRQDESHQREFIEIVCLWEDLAIVKTFDFPELREFPMIWQLFPKPDRKDFA